MYDDHYYMTVQQSLSRIHLYDNYDRSGPKIFVGEWATRVGEPTPPEIAAVTDAAWLTGLERNADVILMNCYAPLLVNVNPGGWQWQTNLIGYNALKSFGSPSYYIQKMFSNNLGDVVLPTKIDSVPMIPAAQLPLTAQGNRGRGGPLAPVEGVALSASRKMDSGDIILKIVNAQATAQSLEINLAGVPKVDANAVMDVLSGQPDDVNTIAEPEKIVPHRVAISDASTKFTHEFPAYSVSVIRLKAAPVTK